MAKTVTLVTPGAKSHYSASNINTNFSSLNTNFSSFLHLNGTSESSNSMLGNLDMGAKKVTNAGTPSLSSDLATKGYVDALSNLAATGTLTDTIVQDADSDTGVQTEASADLDRLDLFAGTSGGADNAIQVVGDDATASSLANPYIDVLKHVVLATGARIGDAVAANTYIEMTRSGSADVIFLVAGGNKSLDLAATSITASQHILMADAGATAAGKRIGDEDGDTYIDFNTATGGTDDDIIRLVSRGSAVATFGPTTNTLAGAGVDVIFSDNVGVGISAFPADSESKAIFMATGTTTTSIANLNDNEIVLYSVVNTGVQNDLKIDFKTGAGTKSTLILGKDCTFPNDVTVVGDVLISGTTASSSKDTGALVVDGGLGVEENVNVGGTLAVTGASTLTGAVAITGTLAPNGLMLASAWPSFSATKTLQTLTAGAGATKLTSDTEDFDTNSDYDHTTNHRFTPSVAGKYLITFTSNVEAATSSGDFSLFLYKNGAQYRQYLYKGVTTSARGVGFSSVVDFNGTTDYVEIFGSATTQNMSVGESATDNWEFSGSRIA